MLFLTALTYLSRKTISKQVLLSLSCAQENDCNSPFDLVTGSISKEMFVPNRRPRKCLPSHLAARKGRRDRKGRKNEWSRELGSTVLKTEVLPPLHEFLARAPWQQLDSSLLSLIDCHHMVGCTVWLPQRAMKDEMLPGRSTQVPVHFWQWNFHCTPHSHSTSARIFWSISKEDHITYSRIFCKFGLPWSFACGPLGTFDLQMKMGDICRDFQWRGNGSFSSWRCGKQWGFQEGMLYTYSWHKLKETIYIHFNGTVKLGNSATNPDHHLLATYLCYLYRHKVLMQHMEAPFSG